MSGIGGVICSDGSAVTASMLVAMLQKMAKRGPDRQAILHEGNAGFGQVLLATTPEALAEQQPWVHPQSSCIVVSDSRLDHRQQLLLQLGITRPANEVGDGELLHAAWQRWGEDCADRLRGDFAFAIWNPREQELFIARDPMGVRPFLFHYDPGRLFVFASSTAAVLAQGAVPRTLDEGRIADALIQETEGIDQSCTFYTAVQRLPPAHWMRLRAGVTRQQRYWRPINDRPKGLPGNEAEWIEAQREQLDRAVRLRLRSQRPVGSMCSGGLDSSSVVALASAANTAEHGPPLPVFSAINSADPDCAETRHIRAVVAHLRCEPTLVDLQDFIRSNSHILALWQEMEEPFDGTMTLVATLYEAAAAQGVVCLMDGVPADNFYATGRNVQRLFDQGRWHEAWRAALAQNPYLPALRNMLGCLLPEWYHTLRRWQGEAGDYRTLLRSSLINPEFAHRIQLQQRYHRYARTIADSHQWHESSEALSNLAAPYITAGLERYNRVASLFSIEPRPPFTDRDLIEFSAWLPLPLRIRDGHMKWILRQAMVERLPPEVVWRRDKGHIGWQFNQALQRACAMGMMHATLSENGWLDMQRLTEALQQPNVKANVGVLPAVLTLLWWKQGFDA